MKCCLMIGYTVTWVKRQIPQIFLYRLHNKHQLGIHTGPQNLLNPAPNVRGVN